VKAHESNQTFAPSAGDLSSRSGDMCDSPLEPSGLADRPLDVNDSMGTTPLGRGRCVALLLLVTTLSLFAALPLGPGASQARPTPSTVVTIQLSPAPGRAG
jgi:hypothetical protein